MAHVRKYLFLSALFLSVTVIVASAEEKVERPKVYAIAYQVGSLLELKELADKEKWIVTLFPRRANKIVVALRTDRVDLLDSRYSNWRKLEEDVKENNNKDGKLHVIYFYNVEKDGEITLEKYNRYNSDL